MTVKETFLSKLALEGEAAASNFVLSQSIASKLRGDDGFFQREDVRTWMQEIIREDCLGLFKIFWNAGWRFDEKMGEICIQYLRRDSEILAFIWGVNREACVETGTIPYTLEAFLSIPALGHSGLVPSDLLPALCANSKWRDEIIKNEFLALVTQDPTWFDKVSQNELVQQFQAKPTPDLLASYISWLQKCQRPLETNPLVQKALSSQDIRILQVLLVAGLLNQQRRLELAKLKFATQMESWRLEEADVRDFYATGFTLADVEPEKVLKLEERALNHVVPGSNLNDYEILVKFKHHWTSPRAVSVFCKFLPPALLSAHYPFFKQLLQNPAYTGRQDLIRLLATGKNEHVFKRLIEDGSIDLTKDIDHSIVAGYITSGGNVELLEKLLAIKSWKLPSLLAVALKANNQPFIAVLIKQGCPLADNVLVAAAQSGNEACIVAALTANAISANMLPTLYRVAVVNRQHKLITLLEKQVSKATDLLTLIPQYFKAPEAPLTE